MMCIDCLYWTRLTERPYYPDRGTKFGDCSRGHFVYTGDGQFPLRGDELLYWDCESCSGAGFETGECFGCIHFEVKE